MSATVLWLITGLSLAAQIILLILGQTKLSDFRWEHLPFHSGVEAAGSVIALLVAVLVLSLNKQDEGPSFGLWISGALVGMGVLDGMHALVHVGNLFVWLHSTATFIGGLLFSLVWLPQQWRAPRWWPMVVLVASLAFCVVNMIVPQLAPMMTFSGQFTPAARMLNIIGGVLLLAAAVRLALVWRKQRNNDDVLFCLLCVQFGVAGIMFEFSALWDFPWWGWHLLRLMAYMIAVAYVILCDQAEAKLSAAEARSTQLLETAPDAIVIIDDDGRIQTVNAQTERMFGYAREEMIGQEVEMLLPKKLRGTYIGYRQQYVRAPRTLQMGSQLDLLASRKDGGEFPVEVRLSPLQTEKGLVVSGAIRDVTDRREAQKQLQMARETADAANRAKGNFLANMSHEIRTPMNGIMGMTELALGTELTKEQREFLVTIESSAESLLSLINDILDFSKIEAKKLELDPIDFELRERIGETLSTLAARAHDKGLELAFEVDSDVPELLVGDVHRLRQILINLLGNAIKFTEHGEILLHIQLISQTEQSIAIRFAVSDTGIGLAEEKLSTIFQPFEQADVSTTRKYGGTGLGLAICVRLVEMMGGKMKVESKLDCGTTFSFTAELEIPSRSAETHAHGPTAHGLTANRLPPRTELQGLRVLVVDDNQTNRRILSKMLENWGMRSVVVDSAAKGLQELRSSLADDPIKLILSDVNMPEMDGFMFAEQIVNDAEMKGTPIILLTSANRSGDGARCRELGIAAHLVKPARQSFLFDAIATSVGANIATIANDEVSENATPTVQAAGNLRLLLVEDNHVNQKFAVRVLSKAGHQVTVANDGQEAVDAWSAESFDVVLMDIQMPIMDGYLATAEIRRREAASFRHTPIIAMTAHAMAGDKQKCLDAGMDGYVTKPVKSKLMLAEISRVLKNISRGTDSVPRKEPLDEGSVW